MKPSLLLLTLLLPLTLPAQADQKTWFFGGIEGEITTGLQFSGPNDDPVPYNDIRFPLDMQENNVIVSDPGSGEVQFYSDGRSIVDRSNVIMPNGGGLLGGPSNMYGTSIVFDPSGCNRYYLFYGQSEDDTPPRKAYYSVLDLDLPGNGTLISPQGDVDVTQKNIQFTANNMNVTEGFYAIPKAGSPRESWLFVGQRNGNLLHVYDVSSTGVDLHVTYAFADLFPTFPNTENLFGIRLIYEGDTDTTGRLVVAPARTSENGVLPIGHTTFNRNTGFLDENITLISDNTEWTYGLAFSPDGTKLYYSDYFQNGLYQYDFVTATLTLITTSPHSGRSGGLLLAPNQKIYWADRFNNFNMTRVTSLSAINNPNEQGAACGLQYNAYVIDGNPSPRLIGALPTFGSFPPPSLVEQTRAASCENDIGSATITRLRGEPPFTFEWDNGETGQTAFFLFAGLRQVTITDAVGCTSVLEVMIDGETDTNFVPPIDISGSPCIGETLTLSSIESDSFTYRWSGPNGFMATTPSIILTDLSAEQAGTYSLILATLDSCISDPGTVEVVVNMGTGVNVPEERAVCDSTVVLDLPANLNDVIWDDGTTALNRRVNSSGVYSFNAIDSNGCPVEDSIRVDLFPVPLVNLPEEVVVPECTEITVSGTDAGENMINYTWSASAGIQLGCISCPEVNLSAETPGFLRLTISDPLTNCSATDSTSVQVLANYEVYVPNAFSPDFDGVNDGFTLFAKNPNTVIERMEIYDRWGGLIFEGDNIPVNQPEQGWQGNFIEARVSQQSKKLNTEVFVYNLNVLFVDGTRQNYAGDVHLLR